MEVTCGKKLTIRSPFHLQLGGYQNDPVSKEGDMSLIMKKNTPKCLPMEELPKLDPNLTNWTESRRGDRGGGSGSGRRGKRGGGRGTRGKGKRGKGNTKFGEGTSNIDEENVVTPTVKSDNEEVRDVESPNVDDEIRVDVKSDIDFMR
ncbi:unnamed protein product [Lactuca saligna]|uniref:Uncharacterized protein n=1 Tax=Lactuca saligna TaxID=75948 RepID=A0AA35VJP7_LACSI|nr:unnamed protein product [Lactuca saligna]